MIYLRVYARALVLVTLVAMNTKQIAMGHYGAAAVVGMCISMVWWGNSSKDRPALPYAGLAYGVGGGCGTLLGVYLAGLIGG